MSNKIFNIFFRTVKVALLSIMLLYSLYFAYILFILKDVSVLYDIFPGKSILELLGILALSLLAIPISFILLLMEIDYLCATVRGNDSNAIKGMQNKK